MHYFTRFKNHEHSCQLEQRLLKTATEKMEQLSRALRGREGGPPDTTFIEDAVLELLKTRRILKCSYPYGFFLEPKSTKKEIYELMQTDLEMVTEDLAQKVNRPYLRTPRHKIIRAACLVQQKRQEFLASVARGVAPNDSPEAPRRSFAGGTWDWEYLGFASAEEYAEFQYRRRHRQRRRGDMSSLRSNTPDPDDSSDSILDAQEEAAGRRRHLMALGSLDDDDPNILLAIQLSLQDSAMAEIWSDRAVPANAASPAAVGASPPSRLEQSAPGAELLSRAARSGSERLDLGDNLARLGNIDIDIDIVTAQHRNGRRRAHGASAPIPVAPGGSDSSTGLFSSSSDTLDCTTGAGHDPSTSSAAVADARLLGNIVAWFHDMNPRGVALVPPTSSDTDADLQEGGGGKPQEVAAEVGFVSRRPRGMRMEEEEEQCAVAQRPTQLDLEPLPLTALDHAERGGSKVRRVDTPQCDSGSDTLLSTSSSEWEDQDQVHLV